MLEASAAPPEPLQAALDSLPGIGPSRAALFATHFRVHCLADLLTLLPRDYLAPPQEVPLEKLAHFSGQRIRVKARLLRLNFWRRGRQATLKLALGRPNLEAGDPAAGEVLAEVFYFNQPYLRKQLEVGQQWCFEGQLPPQPPADGARPRLIAPQRLPLDAPPPARGLTPVYPEAPALSAAMVGRAVQAACAHLDQLPDPIPPWVRALAAVPPLKEALAAIHCPLKEASLEVGRRRLALGELWQREQARLAGMGGRAQTALRVPSPPELWQRVRARLPFPLSEAQEAVLTEMRAELADGGPMARLLHGEVGSGKTAVAFALALLVVAAGGQVALMAPTEILARQHVATFRRWLQGSQVRLLSCFGDDRAEQRRELQAALAEAQPAIVIGTHALLAPRLRFTALSLVIFDEQHRFGVRQKAALVAKGQAPHVLTMTATPIPRTLAWAHYGAVTISTLPQRVGSQARITTALSPLTAWREVAQAWRPALAAGEPAFVVVPHVDGERGLEAWRRRLLSGPWRGLPSVAVHGRLPGAEVAAAVEAFRRGDCPLLFGTTVVEVGLDVPAVPRMLVCGAERFGLATLHQLRGRLSRGAAAPDGLCQLLVDGEEAHERLDFLRTAADGFQVAAEDLRRRGPGQLRGRAQHGHQRFHSFDPQRDEDLVQLFSRQEIRNALADHG